MKLELVAGVLCAVVVLSAVRDGRCDPLAPHAKAHTSFVALVPDYAAPSAWPANES